MSIYRLVLPCILVLVFSSCGSHRWSSCWNSHVVSFACAGSPYVIAFAADTRECCQTRAIVFDTRDILLVLRFVRRSCICHYFCGWYPWHTCDFFSLASVLFSWRCKVIWKCNLLNSIFSIALCCVLNLKFVSFYVTLNSRLWIYVPAEISCWSKGLGSIDILAFITIIDIRAESSLAYNDLFGILLIYGLNQV